jgi:hypothetical protein
MCVRVCSLCVCFPGNYGFSNCIYMLLVLSERCINRTQAISVHRRGGLSTLPVGVA